MDIKTLISLEPGDSVSAFNEPLHCTGKVKIILDGGDERYWLIDEEGGMLSLAPEDDEIILFGPVDEILEPQEEVILHGNKEYEFSYEDTGISKEVAGEVMAEADDHFQFSDYESTDGRIVRIVENQNTGEISRYEGQMISEEDISEL
ncbi:hypothetical protein A2239_04350 [Candidatus Uhrbacteria bacterium RIFOXYA2_FULL_40_9]|nr:MAG: hypothetical protein UT94_C0002G0023 [Candidatus Uhrbacteria bacterium GW2011_GWF2_40_263]OGL92982.1 MAG: hypothetical protein A2239_04350 [Candidatus Uhrbacteria bacterium RIFOXYA2_FULL_40_9]OGL97392.1 MAG: hypothetical protein A2332_04710 [Candidatus Uhrbacteria bacterium RIFOXYB2_FULL_41_18]HBK35018.1 hypothetical protein [Candidatus Uhrbacteria bacterium]HCB56171.1 hypothetical protein [Candidatus Uhrbacteria bacterium]